MEAGADPHTWQPSARDSELIFGADLVVANGLGLEEGLLGVLEQAETEGVPVFHAADHVDAAPHAEDPARADEPAGSDTSTGAPADADGHEHAQGDPHIWLDPLAMREVILALEPALAEIGVDVVDDTIRLADELTALDREVSRILSSVPPDRRRLVSGHGALGRFADRYGFEVVGTVVPGLSSADEPSARDIAELVQSIREAGVSAVFTDATTSRSVADAVAAETGVRIVSISVERVPASGSYADLMRELAMTIADALRT
jgi:zinc/manganese transport system substrate-binding protein